MILILCSVAYALLLFTVGGWLLGGNIPQWVNAGWLTLAGAVLLASVPIAVMAHPGWGTLLVLALVGVAWATTAFFARRRLT